MRDPLRNRKHVLRHAWIVARLVLCCAWAVVGIARCCFAQGGDGLDSATATHLAGLRFRGLYRLAEAEIEHRLTWTRLAPEVETDLVLELAETMLAHARALSETERQPLWDRVREVVGTRLGGEAHSARKELLELQLVLIDREIALASLRHQSVAPWDRGNQEQGMEAASRGLQRLREMTGRFDQPARPAPRPKLGQPSASLRVRLRVLQGELELWQAEFAVEPTDRAAMLLTARKTLQPLVELRTETIQAERSRLLLIRAARIGGDCRDARKMIEVVRRKTSDPLLEELLAREEIECCLADADLGEARRLAMLWSSRNSANTDVPGGPETDWETRLLLGRVLVTAWRAEREARSQLADRDFRNAQEVLSEGQDSAPGEWRELFELLLATIREEQSLGPELASLALQIQQATSRGDGEVAERLLARGVQLAQRRGMTDRAVDWGIQRGSLALARKDWLSAADDLLSLSREFPSSARVAEAHLLGAYALGRAWRENPESESQNQYRTALEQFLERFPQNSQRPEADWMLAELCRWEGREAEALDHYDRIPPGHPRSPRAVESLSRLIVQRVRQGQKWEAAKWVPLRERLLERLPTGDDSWGNPDRSMALAIAEVELKGDQPNWPLVDRLLDRVSEVEEPDLGNMAHSPPVEDADRVTFLQDRSLEVLTLRIQSLAGQGRWKEVEPLLSEAMERDVKSLLPVLEAMTSPAVREEGEQGPLQGRWGLLLRVARDIEAHRSGLSRDESGRLDWVLARIHASNDQPKEARDCYERVFKDSPGNRRAASEYAGFLLTSSEAVWQQRGIQILKGIEQRFRNGTEEWLDARLELVAALKKINQVDEACRQLTKTTLLYPRLGTDEQKVRIRSLGRDCRKAAQ